MLDPIFDHFCTVEHRSLVGVELHDHLRVGAREFVLHGEYLDWRTVIQGPKSCGSVGVPEPRGGSATERFHR